MNALPLALGTAQLGLDYGIANPAGRPSERETDRILRTALELGVPWIDTAPVYGAAEEIIGRFLREAASSAAPRIGTKLAPLPSGLSSKALQREVVAAIDASRSRLSIDTLDLLLLHSPANLGEYRRALVDCLLEQTHAGRVTRVGMSVYELDEASAVLDHPQFSATQFPFSVFDTRFARSGMTDTLRRAGHHTFARGNLHQGLLTMTPDRAEAAVPGAGPWVARFLAVCADHRVRPVNAALGFAARRSGASWMVVGVVTAAQLREVAHGLRGELPAALLRDLDGQFHDVPDAVRDPRAWQARPGRGSVS